MITRNFELTLRIPEQDNIPSCFKVVQNDKSVYSLTVKLTDGINEVTYSQIGSSTITFSKADGNVVQGNMTVGVSSLTYTMGTNDIAYPGIVWASIQLFGASGERLTSARFRFEVVGDLITPAAVQSTSQFPILQQITNDVNGIIATEASRVTAENARVAAEQIRQNTLDFPVTNLISNGDFSNGATGWNFAGVSSPAISAEQNKIGTNSAKMVTTGGSSIASQDIVSPVSHKIYLASWFYLLAYTSGVAYALTITDYGTWNNPITANLNNNLLSQWQLISTIVTAGTSGGIRVGVGTLGAVTRTLYADGVLAIDLTAAFGAGKEPSQIEMDYLMSYYINNWFDGTVNPFRPFKDIGTRALFTDFAAKNIVTNGNFANGTASWAASGTPILTVANNELSSLARAQYDGPVQFYPTAKYNNHKLYVAADLKVTNGDVFLIVNDGIAQLMLTPAVYNAYKRTSGIWTVASTSVQVFVKLQDNNTSAWVNQYMKNVILIDLTATFGAGNEPTAAEMDRMLAKFTNNWFDGTVNPLLSMPELFVYANKNKANRVQESVIAPTLINSWVDYGGVYQTSGYYKDDMGIVHIDGCVKSGTTGTVAFVLPTGYRPPKTVAFTCTDGGSLPAYVVIRSDGTVTIYGTTISQVFLSGINFKAA